MERIASFNVDHRTIEPGMYISRTDGDVTTYDLRTRKPNAGSYMQNLVIHSVEHLFATFIRNSEIAADVLYFGPMGCRTGFYLLVRNADGARDLCVVRETLRRITEYDGPMPGGSEAECGNFRELDVDCARAECRGYSDVLSAKTVADLHYPGLRA